MSADICAADIRGGVCCLLKLTCITKQLRAQKSMDVIEAVIVLGSV